MLLRFASALPAIDRSFALVASALGALMLGASALGALALCALAHPVLGAIVLASYTWFALRWIAEAAQARARASAIDREWEARALIRSLSALSAREIL